MIKSPFENVVASSQGMDTGGVEPSDKTLTVPTLTMTAPRPIIAGWAAERLLHGKKGVSPIVAVALATDMEGALGRYIDKKWPDSGLGSSKSGAELDIYADTAALVEIAGASLFAPRMPLLGKLSVATVLGFEGNKTIWAIRKNRQYKRAGGKGNMYIPPTNEGKCSMAEKMTALGLAVLASDFDTQPARQSIAATAMAIAVIGSARGEKQRQEYKEIADQKIAQLLS